MDQHPTDPTTYDLSLRIGSWLDAAFTTHAHGERFVFQMTVQVLPSTAPDQPPSFVPAVIFWLPGALVGTLMSGTFSISNPVMVTAEEIEKTVAGICTSMLAARSADLLATSNGHHEPPPPLRLAPE